MMTVTDRLVYARQILLYKHLVDYVPIGDIFIINIINIFQRYIMANSTTPAWAKQLIKEVSSLSKNVGNLEKQTLLNCSKLTALDKIFSKEIPLIRVRLDTLCASSKNTETHLNRIEKNVVKINSKI